MSYYTFAQCARAAAFPALLLTSILSLAFVTVAAQDKKQTQSSADDDVIKITSRSEGVQAATAIVSTQPKPRNLTSRLL